MLGRAVLLLVSGVAAEMCSPESCTGAGDGACPVPQGLVSKPSLPAKRENVYFRNAATTPAEISRVDGAGVEWPQGILPAGMRRALPTLHGDVWHARAVTDGPANGRLMLEHRIGAIPIKACDCPQPEFVDCSKPISKADPSVMYDPVVFENQAGEPVDLWYWNGTCEELISWDEVGGLQPSRSKPLLSFQGHRWRPPPPPFRFAPLRVSPPPPLGASAGAAAFAWPSERQTPYLPPPPCSPCSTCGDLGDRCTSPP